MEESILGQARNLTAQCLEAYHSPALPQKIKNEFKLVKTIKQPVHYACPRFSWNLVPVKHCNDIPVVAVSPCAC